MKCKTKEARMVRREKEGSRPKDKHWQQENSKREAGPNRKGGKLH